MKIQSVFQNFTNQYSVSKTLKFELKPVGKTLQMLKENRVLENDKQIDENYHKAKVFFDRLHREFVIEALTGASISGLEEYFNSFKNTKLIRRIRMQGKILNLVLKKLRHKF